MQVLVTKEYFRFVFKLKMGTKLRTYANWYSIHRHINKTSQSVFSTI